MNDITPQRLRELAGLSEVEILTESNFKKKVVNVHLSELYKKIKGWAFTYFRDLTWEDLVLRGFDNSYAEEHSGRFVFYTLKDGNIPFVLDVMSNNRDRDKVVVQFPIPRLSRDRYGVKKKIRTKIENALKAEEVNKATISKNPSPTLSVRNQRYQSNK